jgi:pimeloyl-ACP methyl ester carboxylesterase
MARSTVLLIHGFTDTEHAWDALRPHLEPDFDVLAPTLVGHHGGAPIPSGMTDPLATMADDLERRLDEAGIEQAAIVGNSLGGWLAFVLAGRDRATSITALSPALGWPEDLPPARTQRQFARAHRMAPLGARFARRIVRRPSLRTLAFWELVAHPERIPPSTAAELIRGAADCPMYDPFNAQVESGQARANWQALSVPTVIGWGTRDRTIPLHRCSSWFRDALPDAVWVDLPGCGHLPQHDDPELVAALVREVIDGSSPLVREAAAQGVATTAPGSSSAGSSGAGSHD